MATKLEPLVLPHYFVEHAIKAGWKEGEQFALEPGSFPYEYIGRLDYRTGEACRVIGRCGSRRVHLKFQDGSDLKAAPRMIRLRDGGSNVV